MAYEADVQPSIIANCPLVITQEIVNAERERLDVALIPIPRCDMDALGHVNNMLYIGYVEQARATWLDAMRPILH